MHDPSGERLQKVIAAAGIASRRVAEELITAGRVRVNGEVVSQLGVRVDPVKARIEVDGRRIETNPDHEYVLLNKPSNVVTTSKDPQRRRTVMDLVHTAHRLFPVGRLDADTQGVLLLTNHGELAHRLTHPKFGVRRVYTAEVEGRMPATAAKKLVAGIELEDGLAKATEAKITGHAAGRTHVEIVMTEGRKREVRRMLEAVGYPVLALVRTAFGPITLGSLRTGKTRELTAEEIGLLLREVDL